MRLELCQKHFHNIGQFTNKLKFWDFKIHVHVVPFEDRWLLNNCYH